MAELSWIHVFLFMILKLQLKATSGQYFYATVTPGADVTLPCGNGEIQQDECRKTGWIFKRSQDNSLELVTSGKMNTNKSDRLNLTKTCSLAIKNVTVDDVGLYNCTQGQTSKGLVYLSVVTMTEQTAGDQVTVTCSVSSFGECEYKVKWLREDEDVNPGRSSGSSCSDNVSFPNTSTLNSLKCEVTQPGERVLLFPFRPPASNGETALRWFIVVGLVALIVIGVVVVRRYKTRKGKKTQENHADPDDGVSYASIGFKKRRSKAQVQIRDEGGEDDGDVTYSTVKAASSAAASNKPNE